MTPPTYECCEHAADRARRKIQRAQAVAIANLRGLAAGLRDGSRILEIVNHLDAATKPRKRK